MNYTEQQAEWITQQILQELATSEKTAAPAAAPVALMAELNRCFGEDDIICFDAGNPGAW